MDDQVRSWEGKLSGAGFRFALVVSRFNSFITERLLGGAIDGLVRTGCAREALEVAEEANDQPTLDLLTQRMQIHEKNAWMLRSLLKK